MANDIPFRQGTEIVWRGWGVRDYDLTLNQLPNNAGRCGDKADLGVCANNTIPRRFAVILTTEANDAPTAGLTIEIYWAASHDNERFPGGAAGVDSFYKSGEEDEWKKQLQLIGCLVVTNNAAVLDGSSSSSGEPENAPGIQRQVFAFTPILRYGCPVIINKCGQSLEDDDLVHELRFIAAVDQQQD